jgi:hypothetical protein
MGQIFSQLLDTRTLRRFAARPPAATDAPLPSNRGLFAAVKATPLAVRQIFSEFQDVANLEAKHKTVHHIKTTGPPATARFRRLDASKLAAAKAEFYKLERGDHQEVFEYLVCTLAHDYEAGWHGTWRPCGDYRHLNLVTTLDLYPLPNIQDLSGRLHCCSIFSKLDLRKGYYQIPVQVSDMMPTSPRLQSSRPSDFGNFCRCRLGCRMLGSLFNASWSWTRYWRGWTLPSAIWTTS